MAQDEDCLTDAQVERIAQRVVALIARKMAPPVDLKSVRTEPDDDRTATHHQV